MYTQNRINVTTVVTKGLLARKSNKEILADVKKVLPNASTTLTTIRWYRNQLRKSGENVPTARELRREERNFKDILS